MEIRDDDLRPHLEELLESLGRLHEKGSRGLRVQVSHVLRRKGLIPGGEARRRRQVASQREDWKPRGHREGNRLRNEAPRPPDEDGTVRRRADDRIVHPPDHVPVVEEEQVGDSRQFLKRLPVAAADRLVARVPAGHDEDIVRSSPK